MYGIKRKNADKLASPDSSCLSLVPQDQASYSAMWSQRLCAMLRQQVDMAGKLSQAQTENSASLYDAIGQRHSLVRDLQFSVRDYSRMRRRVFERLTPDVQEVIKREEAAARTAVARVMTVVQGGQHV